MDDVEARGEDRPRARLDVVGSWAQLAGALLLLLGAILAALGTIVAVSPYDPATNQEAYVATMFVGAALGELLALGLLVLLLRRRGKRLADLGFGRRTTWVGIVAGIVAASGYAAVTALTVPAVPGNIVAFTWLKLLAIVTTGLVAATVEETICRGYVMTAVQSLGRGRAVQVLVGAVAYSLAHPSNPVAMLFTFVLGAALGAVYLLGNRSLTPVIVSHMLVNVIIEPGLYLSITSGFTQ